MLQSRYVDLLPNAEQVFPDTQYSTFTIFFVFTTFCLLHNWLCLIFYDILSMCSLVLQASRVKPSFSLFSYHAFIFAQLFTGTWLFYYVGNPALSWKYQLHYLRKYKLIWCEFTKYIPRHTGRWYTIGWSLTSSQFIKTLYIFVWLLCFLTFKYDISLRLLNTHLI